MSDNQMHYRAITRRPEIAQTGNQAKYDSMLSILEMIALIPRQAAWKVFVFPGDSTGGGGGGTGGGTGGGGIGV